MRSMLAPEGQRPQASASDANESQHVDAGGRGPRRRTRPRSRDSSGFETEENMSERYHPSLQWLGLNHPIVSHSQLHGNPAWFAVAAAPEDGACVAATPLTASTFLTERVMGTQNTRRRIAFRCSGWKAASGQKLSHDQFVEKARGKRLGTRPSLFRQ